MKVNKGELITLDNDKEYICFSTISDGGQEYVYLMSNFKPLEVKFASQKITENGEIELEIVNDTEEKQRLLELFQI